MSNINLHDSQFMFDTCKESWDFRFLIYRTKQDKYLCIREIRNPIKVS